MHLFAARPGVIIGRKGQEVDRLKAELEEIKIAHATQMQKSELETRELYLLLRDAHRHQENKMQIQVNTDHNIAGHEALTTYVTTCVENALSRFSEHITRVEVHLTDENANKGGEHDKRCLMEARLEGRQPIVSTDHAATLDQAILGAVHKLTSLIESTLGRAEHSSHTR